MKNLLLLTFCSLVITTTSWAADYQLPKHSVREHTFVPKIEKPALKPERVSVPRVILYRTPVCGACDQAAAYMQQKNIAFESQDVRQNRATFAAFVRRAAGRLPQIMIDGKRIDGFNRNKIDKIYQEALKLRQSQ